MTASDIWNAVSVFVGIAGVVVGIIGVKEGRQQRSKRHQADLIIQDLVGQLRGFLIGIKPAVQHNEATTRAVNDNIALIKSAKKKLDEIN